MATAKGKKSVHFPRERAGVLLRLRRLLASLRQRVSGPRTSRNACCPDCNSPFICCPHVQQPQRPEMLSASRGLGSCWRRRERQGRLEADRHPSIPGAWCVSPQTLADLMDRSTTEQGKLHILDCRYPYEFQAGHIRGAINVHSPRVLSSFMERLEEPLVDHADPSVVVYCDFSQKRAPKIVKSLMMFQYMIGRLGGRGRKGPRICILSGGYVNFCFGEETRRLCEPSGYVPVVLAPLDTDFSSLRYEWSSDRFHRSLIERIRYSVRLRKEEEEEKSREVEERREGLDSVLKTSSTDTPPSTDTWPSTHILPSTDLRPSRWGHMADSMDTEEAKRARGMRGT